MAFCLEICRKKKDVIEFLFWEKEITANIHLSLMNFYGKDARDVMHINKPVSRINEEHRDNRGTDFSQVRSCCGL